MLVTHLITASVQVKLSKTLSSPPHFSPLSTSIAPVYSYSLWLSSPGNSDHCVLAVGAQSACWAAAEGAPFMCQEVLAIELPGMSVGFKLCFHPAVSEWGGSLIACRSVCRQGRTIRGCRERKKSHKSAFFFLLMFYAGPES